MKGNKGLKRAAAVALSALAVCNLVACGPKKGGEKVNPNMTQFHIGNFNGGYGYAWLQEAVDLFEKQFANESFEENKEGVQIWINNAKDEFEGWTFYTTIAGRQEDFYVGADARKEIVDGNLIVEIDDILDGPLTEFGEEKSIRQKLSPYYLESVAAAPKTVTLPYAEAYFGTISYDIKLFEDKKFFIKDGSTTDNLSWTGADNKSAGLDQIKGTYDDGLPCNETEFFELLDRIYSRGVIPMTWTGQYAAYTTAWALNLFMNYDDGEAQKIYNTGFGEYTFPGDSEPTVFDGFNFYELTKHPARLKTIETVARLVRNTNYYSSEAYKTTQSHIAAQNEFVTSVLKDQQVAMIIEGTWWENESLDMFNRMAKNDASYSRNNRRFGIMPTFRLSGGTAQKTTFMASNQLMFINANSEHKDLAKLFMKFLCTDKVRNIFTKHTGVPSPFDYKLDDEIYESLSPYGKTLWDIHENEHGTLNFVTENRDYHPAYLEDVKYPYPFHSNVQDPGSTVGATSDLFNFFKYDITGKTPKQYFDGMYNYATMIYDEVYAKNHGPRN